MRSLPLLSLLSLLCACSTFSLIGSGNATFDAAVRAALESKVGSSVPPPPEHYPGLLPPSLSFRMTCSGACD